MGLKASLQANEPPEIHHVNPPTARHSRARANLRNELEQVAVLVVEVAGPDRVRFAIDCNGV